jgi:hypothetical protein
LKTDAGLLESINQLVYLLAFLFASYAQLDEGASRENGQEGDKEKEEAGGAIMQMLKLVIAETEEKMKAIIFNPERQSEIATMVIFFLSPLSLPRNSLSLSSLLLLTSQTLQPSPAVQPSNQDISPSITSSSPGSREIPSP